MSILGSFLSNSKTSGSDAGNALQFLNADSGKNAQGQIDKLLNYQSNPAITDPLQGSRTATNEVQNNNILGQLFGNGGTLQNTVKQENDLSNRGFSLQPEDYEAYGQGSDQIARNFGNSQASLAQALASRGISGSAAAGTAFAGSEGNKMEQLGQMQRQIANDRMNMNMQRLGQTRSFLSSLSGQASNDINQQNSRQMGAEQNNFGELVSKNNAAQSRLEAMQNQGNENMSQRAQTEETPGWIQGLSGLEDMGRQNIATMVGGMSGGGIGAGGGGALASGTPKPLPATKFSPSNNYGMA